MSAWGTNGSARSCEALLRRLETNDPTLVDLVVLPLKHFGSQELIRVAVCLGTTTNTTLRSLQASGHTIDDCHAFELLGQSMVSIEKIAIGDATMGDPGLMALCRGLETNPTMQLHDTTTKTNTHTKGTNCNKLRSIDLSYKNIGPKGLRTLLRVCSSSSLSLSASLQSLDLSRNTTIGPSFDFGEYATTTTTTPTSPLVPSSLPTLFPCLTYLNLSECQLDTKSCTSLFKAMMTRIQQQEQQQNRKLILKLNSNPLNSSSYSNDNTNTNPEDNNLHKMITILVRGNRVSELELARCGIGNTGLAQMIDAAAYCSSHSDSNDNQNNNKIDLERLDLSNNKITSVSYLLTTAQQKQQQQQQQQQLPPSAPKSSHYFSHLRSLNLSGNPLGATLTNSILIEECSYPMIMMMSSVLEELDLSQTSCDVSAAVALIRWCSRSNTSTKQNTMKTLNLFGNHFGSEGLIALSTVLQGGHPSLEYLDLGGNNASEEAVVALVHGLTEPLVRVHQTATTVAAVAAENKDDDTIPKNKNKLRVLVVGGNGGGPALEKAVKVVNKVHPELDIARTKVKKNEEGGGSGSSNNSMFNSSTPGTTWMS